jgi:5-methylthioribose kinase
MTGKSTVMILSENNLVAYIKERLVDKLDFIANAKVRNVAVAGGGLVSAVYKAQVGDHTLYFKQAIPGRLDKVKELVGGDVPEDAFILWYDDRQSAEVKALEIFKQAVPEGFVPIVHHHDTQNHVMVLSEVCGPNGVVLADVMNDEIHIKHAEILGSNIARLANHTYGKFEAIRDDVLEKKIKAVKYRYEVSEVWEKISNPETKNHVIERVSNFVITSSNMSSVLVHGDYHDRNILVCEDGCATYDLEESHLGDPVEDVGKLATSYILRIIYFGKIRQVAYEALIQLLDAYFETLKIPESREVLESRMRIMIAGCLLMRVDGISSMWLPWVHDDAKKEITRQLAVALVLDNKRLSIKDVLKHAKII